MYLSNSLFIWILCLNVITLSDFRPARYAKMAANMNLAHLKAFLAVAQHRSFSRAAEKLYLTQPAVSRQIQALEELLGGRLFDRVGRCILLTEVGNILLPCVHIALQ